MIILLSGQLTTNQLSIKTGINWRTVEAHLTFLIGKSLVAEIFKSEYVRIFKLTPIGEEHAKFLLRTNHAVSQQPQQKERKRIAEKKGVVEL